MADVREGGSPPSAATDWEALERSPEFEALLHARRRFVVPTIALLGIWYIAFLILCAFAQDFMGETLINPFTVGHFWGVSLILLVWVLAFLYLRWSERELDPRAEAVVNAQAPARHEGGVS